MKIGFDFHGVLNTYPKRFKSLMKNLYAGNTIFILSGPPYNQILSELTKLGYQRGVHYQSILSVVDYLKQSGAKMWQDDKDDWWTDETTWWKSKALICKSEKIRLLYDDKLQYKKHMDSKDTIFLHVNAEK